MGAAAEEEQLKILQDDQFNPQIYAKQIGLTATQARIRMLDHRIERVWGDRPRSAGEGRGRSKASDSENLYGADWGSKKSSKASPTSPMSPRKTRETTELQEKDVQLQHDKQRAKEVLRSRIRREREQLQDEWREHQERDEKDIKRLPDDCISKTVKRSLRKMRQNLFQRRMNLAIHERLTNDWTLPKIQAEVKKDRLAAEKKARLKSGKDNLTRIAPAERGEAANE